MRQGIGTIAVEGKHIAKDFRLGDTTTKVLKDISLQVMQGSLSPSWDRPAPEKARCSISLEDWTLQPADRFF